MTIVLVNTKCYQITCKLWGILFDLFNQKSGKIMLNNYLIQIFESTPDAVSISDKEGIIRFVNSKHAALTGVAAEEMINQPAIDLVKKGFFDIVLNPEVVSTRKKIIRLQTKADGKKLVLEASPIFDSNNQVEYVVTFIRDITVLAELQQKLAAQNDLLMAFRELQNEDTSEVVHSQQMRTLYEKVESIAKTSATVLILGETGVGKDVLARAIHNKSPRAHKTFIKIDCGSIPENLIETELFGYAPGTFSGAQKNGKVGLIEAAANGTLFLDEIGELPLSVQTRFLRFLQDREVTRVGSTTPRQVDARIIAATNKDLEKEVQKNRFRSDLYYRLKVAVFEVPPLRRRQDDILPLANAFLGKYGAKYGKAMSISKSAEEMLLHYPWPGNVRELENMLQSLVVSLNKAVLVPADFPINQASVTGEMSMTECVSNLSFEGKTYKEIMQEIEGVVIAMGVRQYGSVAEAARSLKVNRSTLFRKIKP